jgi:hypothetical protein
MVERARAIFAEDENGKETDQIAWLEPAKPEDAVAVLVAPINNDGRSEPVWVRFKDGTLMLAVFPCGDTYMEMSDKGVCDFKYAEPDNA